MKRILFFLLVISMPCYAAIYMQEDAHGNVTYSDTPSEHSRILNIPDVENSSAAFQVTPELNPINDNPTADNTTATSIEQLATQYRSFSIISPKDQENIQNQPTLPVEVKVEPELQKGDKIQLLLDNKLIGNPSESTHIELGQLERGTHLLSAIIVNPNQQVMQKTNSITIYVNRVNVNFKPGANPPPPPPASSSNETTNKSLITKIRELFS